MFSKLKSHSNNLKLFDKISRLAETYNHQIIQKNGQRIYEPLSCCAEAIPPQKGTEIFIGNLPHDFYEDEIIPIFIQIGPIYNIRLMMDFFGRNRGYGFLKFYNAEHAFKAVKEFNGIRIRKNTRLAVTLSVDNCRLFVGNIPREKTYSEIDELLRQYVDGITNIIMYTEPSNPLNNRGFVFVEFESHREAAIARRQLCPGNLILWDQTLFVDWAEPVPIVDPVEWTTISKLYLSNLPVQCSIDELKEFLYRVLPDTSITKVHKIDNYAFVHFSKRRDAEIAFDILPDWRVGGHKLEVEWARPPRYSKQHRNREVPTNYCKSVPPSTRKLVHQSIAARVNRAGSSSSSVDTISRGLEDLSISID